MKIFFVALWSIVLFSISNFSLAQNGTVRGSVLDDRFNEYMPGVNVIVDGTTKGTSTDLDGKFSLSLPAGTYNLKVSFITFQTIVINGVEVKAGEVTLLQDIRLKESVNEIGEAVVSTEAVRNSEVAILAMKSKSANMIDGVSSAGLKKIGDSDAASSAGRVPGISVQGGKYVFVRGLGDRYTKTMMNGLDIPGLDPDRNTIQMDLFPTNIIENIVVHKTFVAELPADFTGGAIDISTKDFPEEKISSLNLGLGFNPNFHFRPDYLTYEGGQFDLLGFDDGTRAIPAENNVPLFVEALTDDDKRTRYQNILSKFNPTLAAMEQTSLLDASVGYTFGNQVEKEKVTIGYNAVLSYKNSTEFYKDAIFARYGLNADPDSTQMSFREYQQGNYGSNNVMLTGLAGFAVKFKNSKIRLQGLHLQNGESKAGIFDYDNSDQGAEFTAFQHNLEYSQRSLTNVLLHGKHFNPGNNWNLEWKLSPTLSTMDDPDIRFTRYRDDSGVPTIGTEAGFPERIWRELSETNISGLAHLSKEMKLFTRKAEIKFGGGHLVKNRDFNIRSFAFNIRNIPLTGDPNELLAPENLWPYNGNFSSGTTFDANFIPDNPNQFSASANNSNAFVSMELSPISRLRAIIGLRAEKYVQRYTGQDQLGVNVLANDVVIDDLDLFPSLSLVYALNEFQNLRASFTQTIARPSLKEQSYAEIYDPLSGRTFIGGLFRDANDVAGVVYWDGDLQSSNITNYDIRWEFFPEKAGQTVSVGAFYKQFKNPIEIVQFATQAGAFQPRNVGDGSVVGGEFELRKSLDFLGEKFQNWAFASNLTYTKSRIKLSKTEFDSRVDNRRTGQTIDEYRDMAGQAPYIINAGFQFSGQEEGLSKGLDVGLFYNVQGPSLLYVGIVDRPDIYTVPFHSLNLNANKKFGKDDRIQMGVKVENLLADAREAVFKSFESEDQFFSQIKPGVALSARFSYDF